MASKKSKQVKPEVEPEVEAIQVKALVSFVSAIGDKKYRVEQDQELPLPAGADWLDVGFVVPVRSQKIETAIIKPAEKATKVNPAEKGPVDKVMRSSEK